MHTFKLFCRKNAITTGWPTLLRKWGYQQGIGNRIEGTEPRADELLCMYIYNIEGIQMHIYNNKFHHPRHALYIIYLFSSSCTILGSFASFFHCQMSSDISYQSGKKRHQCSVCQKKFGRPSALLTHMYTHTGERPFKCHVYV